MFLCSVFHLVVLEDGDETCISVTPQPGMRLLAMDMWSIHFRQTHCRILFHMLCQNEISLFFHFSFVKQTSEA